MFFFGCFFFEENLATKIFFLKNGCFFQLFATKNASNVCCFFSDFCIEKKTPKFAIFENWCFFFGCFFWVFFWFFWVFFKKTPSWLPLASVVVSFFLTREHEKSPINRFLVLYLVFFSGAFFSLTLYFFWGGAVWSFLWDIFVIFWGVTSFFLGKKLKSFLGQICFFSDSIFSAGANF